MNKDGGMEVNEELAERYIEQMGMFGDRDGHISFRCDQFVCVCVTCSSPEERHVICVGCSLHCHSEHELLEVGGKKNMKCLCDSNECMLRDPEENDAKKVEEEDKTPELKNVCEPKHNFEGRFCYCDKPFAVEGETLIQCVICTEWYHPDCLDLRHGDTEDGALVCRECCHFVQRYVHALELRPDMEAPSRPTTCPETVDELDKAEGRSVILIPEFREFLCDCETCTAKFAALFLDEYHGEDTSNLNADEMIAKAIEKEVSKKERKKSKFVCLSQNPDF